MAALMRFMVSYVGWSRFIAVLPAIASVADDVPTAWRIPPAATLVAGMGPADVDAPSLQVGAVQPLNRSHRVRLPRHLNEAKALRFAIRPVHHDVRAAFAAYGPVSSADIVVDRSDGKSKGFGFRPV